ncbi:hypothetical protein LTR56_018671 [Elasticomyces elasticus]|nr:hypothetical protein LTR56_018671 [Elasticomyces elasticus]KAK3642825.1 hypothetical protein LTR22_015883 [Elasticomyces elasticus]KAK4920699.1 hypothetical protein LTR49_011775 [Elasticomyces elasticus]KAK5754113.1 hypothetical protein LTS12_015755 [Elasticomyces elasticus]
MTSLTDVIDKYYAGLIIMLILWALDHYFLGPAVPYVTLQRHTNHNNGVSTLTVAYRNAEVKAWAIGHWDLVVRHTLSLIGGFALCWLIVVVMGIEMPGQGGLV